MALDCMLNRWWRYLVEKPQNFLEKRKKIFARLQRAHFPLCFGAPSPSCPPPFNNVCNESLELNCCNVGNKDSTSTESLGFRKGMVIASLNINSLLRHHDELSNFLFERGIHILALNETKLDSKICKDLLKIENYKIERCDRNREGGGIALYIKDSIKYHVRKDLPEKSLELLCIEVELLKARPFFVISWYRPPSDTVETFDKLDRILQFLETEGKELILLGDTNCDFLKFSSTSDVSCLNNPSKHMQQIYCSYELKQLINKPTRETSLPLSTTLQQVTSTILHLPAF